MNHAVTWPRTPFPKSEMNIIGISNKRTHPGSISKTESIRGPSRAIRMTNPMMPVPLFLKPIMTNMAPNINAAKYASSGKNISIAAIAGPSRFLRLPS